MTRRIQAGTITLVTVLAMVAIWQGCGGSDHGSSDATITGNVTSVSPAQAMLESRSRMFALSDWMFASRAIAQSSCPARHVLACVGSGPGQPVECEKIDTDSCRFAVSFTVVNEFEQGTVAFVDDANDNGQPDSGERLAFLSNPLGSICPGTVVVLNDLVVDFTAQIATAASVDKAPDTCSATATPNATRSVTGTPSSTPTHAPTATGTPPTATPTPTRTPTALPTLTATAAANMTATAAANMTATANATHTGTPTGTQTGTPTGTQTGTPTGSPTYAYGASLNEPPSTMLAFLFGAGVFGLILPHRRRRDPKP